ncbi:MAG: hypothetical protein R3D44_00155 [Hyphomicrobiaceae bacterium]
MRSRTMSFADLGEIFNDATTRMIGGVTAQNERTILRDISLVQSGLERLIAAKPQDFEGTAGIHAQNIIDQLQLEQQVIANRGNDPFAAKYLNDVQRDLIDIVQGDDQLATLATANGKNGFAPVPDLLAAPAQFQGNAEQTDFMRNFVTTSEQLAERAVELVAAGASQSDRDALAAEIQAFGEEANAFTRAQGGLYSARFDNEFAAEGVNGTASRALIEGLKTSDAKLVGAAAEVLVANAQDVAGNMLGIGDDPPDVGNGIPNVIDTFAVAGQVFNDATARLVGGIYDGNAEFGGNRQAIHDDLTAAQQGVQNVLDAGGFDGRAEAHAKRVVDLIGRELALVDNPNAGDGAAKQINKLHASIVNAVQSDPVLAAAANEGDANGFMALPDTLGGNKGNGGGWLGNVAKHTGHDSWGQGAQHGHKVASANDSMGAVQTPDASGNGDGGAMADPLAQIFGQHHYHHHG